MYGIAFARSPFANAPAERVPIHGKGSHDAQRRGVGASEVEVAGRCGHRCDSGLRVLLRAVEHRCVQRQLVGDVIPRRRCGRQRDGAIEGRRGLVHLLEVHVGLAGLDAQPRVLRIERDPLFELLCGAVVPRHLQVERTEIAGVYLSSGIDLDLLEERGFRFFVVAITDVGAAEIVVPGTGRRR